MRGILITGFGEPQVQIGTCLSKQQNAEYYRQKQQQMCSWELRAQFSLTLASVSTLVVIVSTRSYFRQCRVSYHASAGRAQSAYCLRS